MTDLLTLVRPDDWHLHVRDGVLMQTVVPHTSAQFARAIIMPNLPSPVSNSQRALAYQQRILKAVPEGHAFQPLMTLYLTDNTRVEEVEAAVAAGIVAFKLYPAGATTNSDAGVTDMRKVYPVLQAMQEQGMKLLVHGEVTDPDVDVFDREAVFIEQVMMPLRRDFPELKIVFEHISSREAAQYVRDSDSFTAATITAHHLLYNRNAIFAGGLRPHSYCLPVLKRERHRQALLEAASSGSPKFFLGTDSAPHLTHRKESDCGCAGCYTADVALELYAMAFESVHALDKLEAFASFNGPDFYGLPRNVQTVTLKRERWPVPAGYAVGANTLRPLASEQVLPWKLQS